MDLVGLVPKFRLVAGNEAVRAGAYGFDVRIA